MNLDDYTFFSGILLQVDRNSVVVFNNTYIRIFEIDICAIRLFQCFHACFNITVNERINRVRYSYLKDGKGQFYNPFNRGHVKNMKEYFHLIRPLEERDVELLSVRTVWYDFLRKKFWIFVCKLKELVCFWYYPSLTFKNHFLVVHIIDLQLQQSTHLWTKYCVLYNALIFTILKVHFILNQETSIVRQTAETSVYL